MNQLITELVKMLEGEGDSRVQSVSILDKLFPCLGNRGSNIEILKELFLRPYLTSAELSEKYAISEEDLRTVYLSVQSVQEMKDVFKFSRYPYLIETLADLTRDAARTLRIVQGEKPSPPSKTMELFISAACNARCEFCYRHGQLYDDKMMTPLEFESLIDEFADLGGEKLDVSGGLEPLLGPSIREVLERGLDRKLRVTLFTNGIRLDRPDLLDCLLRTDRIRVSVNASDRESYRKVMGVDKFDDVKNNLRSLVMERERRDSDSEIGISFVVYDNNYTKVVDAIKLAQLLEVDFLDLRCAHVTNVLSWKQREELQSILDGIRRGILFGEYGRLRISIGDGFNLNDGQTGLLASLGRDFVNNLVNFRITITPSGKVYALNVIGQPTREDPRYLLGQFSRESSLSSILQNKVSIPFDPRFFLPHDISLMAGLAKLRSDLEFGIGLDESPYNFQA